MQLDLEFTEKANVFCESVIKVFLEEKDGWEDEYYLYANVKEERKIKAYDKRLDKVVVIGYEAIMEGIKC